jgi:hypothetical protein
VTVVPLCGTPAFLLHQAMCAASLPTTYCLLLPNIRPVKIRREQKRMARFGKLVYRASGKHDAMRRASVTDGQSCHVLGRSTMSGP